MYGAVVFGMLLSPAVQAAGDMQNPDRLRGEMFVAGKTLVDPPTDEPRDSHAYLTINGDAARHLYRTLKVSDTPDLCQPGRRLKRLGNITCTVGARSADARCDFSINLGDGSLAPGLVC